MFTHQAMQLASAVHAHQTDKAGKPYIGHPLRVVGHLTALDGYKYLSNEEKDWAKAVAWLHDTVEDTPVTVEFLMGIGFPEEVVEPVDLLTFKPETGQTREGYYAAVKENKIALLVKDADIIDNTDPGRLAVLDGPTRTRLTKKYATARVALGLL